MPPKAAAAPAVAPVEKKEGAKVVYITHPVVGDESIKVALNPVCRTDIFLHNAISLLAKEFSKRATATEATLVAAKAVAAASGDSTAAPDGETETLVARLKDTAKSLSATLGLQSFDLVETANDSKVVLGPMSAQASEILRPAGVYKLDIVSR